MISNTFRLFSLFLFITFLGGCHISAPVAYFEKGSHDGGQGFCSVVVDATASSDIRVVEYSYEIFKEETILLEGRRGAMVTVPSGDKGRIRVPFFLKNTGVSQNDLSILGKVFYFPIDPFEKTFTFFVDLSVCHSVIWLKNEPLCGSMFHVVPFDNVRG